MLARHRLVCLGVVEGDAVLELYDEEMREPAGGGEAEDLGQEGGGFCLVATPDDRVVQLGHGILSAPVWPSSETTSGLDREAPLLWKETDSRDAIQKAQIPEKAVHSSREPVREFGLDLEGPSQLRKLELDSLP